MAKIIYLTVLLLVSSNLTHAEPLSDQAIQSIVNERCSYAQDIGSLSYRLGGRGVSRKSFMASFDRATVTRNDFAMRRQIAEATSFLMYRSVNEDKTSHLAPMPDTTLREHIDTLCHEHPEYFWIFPEDE